MRTLNSRQWHLQPSRLLPRDAMRREGPLLPMIVLLVVNVAGTVRSLIHIFAPDSGAQSIASMDVHVAGGANIVFLLAEWGGAQLLEAFLIWLVLWRYRGLVPLMLLVVTAELVLRQLVGFIKPVVSAYPPPGGVADQFLLPVVAIALLASLLVRRSR